MYFYSNTSASQIYVPYTNDIALGLKAGLHFWNGEVVTFFISQIIRWKAGAGEKVHCKVNSGGTSNSLKSLYVTAVHFIIVKLLQPHMKITFFAVLINIKICWMRHAFCKIVWLLHCCIYCFTYFKINRPISDTMKTENMFV